jgi:hypothetical protein
LHDKLSLAVSVVPCMGANLSHGLFLQENPKIQTYISIHM